MFIPSGCLNLISSTGVTLEPSDSAYHGVSMVIQKNINKNTDSLHNLDTNQGPNTRHVKNI